MTNLYRAFCLLGLATAAVAQPPSVTVSLGIRETEAGGGAAFGGIGSNGGASGAIEWVNLDVLTIPVDGSWQQLTGI